jgi:DNA topoisomerase-2|tara:strand:- start:1125 stop:2480 length:1356 start_codon:yes stop_codon:yes gene_type:complete
MSLDQFISQEDNKTSLGDYPISKVASNEWKSFAMYTVESRAIPNMIDGLKPVQRFYLYSSLINSKRDFKKVSAVAGIISDYGYNHGEASAAGAGQLMAATWNNNICLVEGRGSFGTRLIQEAGAPRYVYTRLSANFEKYIRDIDLAPAHDDPEHEPPSFYVPVIPLVLANGTKGIATGFATNILPRSQKSLSRAVSEYLSSGTIKKRIPITFPDFKGKVVWDTANDRYSILGVYQKKSKTVMEITEVPYGYDRESYVKILDKLEDDGDIVSYDDLCDKAGFSFEIKLKQNTSANWDNEKIIRKFKLSKPASENITVIDYDGKLREYEDERELVKHFCDYRLGILHKRIELRQAEASELARWLKIKMEFIQSVLDDKIIFKNRKKADVGKQILDNTDAIDSDVDKLLRINIMSLTDEMVKELSKEIKSAQAERKFWSKETPKNQFTTDLEGL